MTQTVPATCVLGPGKTGLTIGLRVLNLDGTTYAAFATTGVAETSTAGTYRKTGGVVCPDAGAYIVWGVSGADYAEATVESTAVNVTHSAGIATGGRLAEVTDLPAAAPSAATVADAVWNEDIADHLGPTTTGGRLNLASQAGPVGDMIEAVGYNRFKITALENMRPAVGLATANLDAQLGDLPTNAELAAALAGVTVDPQEIADALLLAPAAGTPAAGSVYAKLDGILEDTGTTLPATLATLATAADLAVVDASVDAILEDTGTTLPGLIAVGVGPGSSTGYYTDTIDDGTNPLDGVRVQLYTAPSRVGPAYEAYTNALGVFEMWPDPGVYYRWLDLAGYNFSQDVAVTVTEP